jgi:DNA repair exonuclease SbcCD ATPase subunit
MNNHQIANRLQEAELSGFWSNSTSPYELVPVAIIATLLCVIAAVAAYRFVSLFFGKRKNLFGKAAGEGTGADELRRLKQHVASLESEKVTLFEQNQKSQRRLSEQQREIEVLQGALNERRADLDRETDELEALKNHAQHLEKQLEEIMIELERIYRNAPEKQIPGLDGGIPVSPPLAHLMPDPSAAKTPQAMDEATKLKEILLAYQQKVAERNARQAKAAKG